MCVDEYGLVVMMAETALNFRIPHAWCVLVELSYKPDCTQLVRMRDQPVSFFPRASVLVLSARNFIT